MAELTKILNRTGVWASAHFRITFGCFAVGAAYLLFPIGLAADSIVLLVLRILFISAAIIIVFSPRADISKQKSTNKQESDQVPDSSTDAENSNGKLIAENGNNDLNLIKELSDNFYVKNRRDAEQDFTLFVRKILKIIKRTFAAQTATIFFINEHTNSALLKGVVSDHDNIDEDFRCAPNEGVVGKVVEGNKAYFSNEIVNVSDLLLYYNGPVTAECVLAAPVLIESEIVGVLCVDSRDRNAFSEEDIQLFETYCGVVAEIILNFHNLFEFENSAKLFSSFYEVSRGLNSNLKFDEILDLLIDLVERVFSFDRITICSFQPGHEMAEILRVRGQIDEFPEGLTFPLDEGLNGLVMRKRRVLRVSDMEKGDYFMPRYHGKEKQNYGLRSFLAVPISYHDFCFGSISVESRKQNKYTERHQRILVMLANNFGVAMERSYVLEQLESLATTDGLTKAYNYRAFTMKLNEETERSLRYKMKFSLLILDLDHFKRVNDTYGHLAGDLVLKKVADEIRRSTRAIDFVARYGGEEFAVVLIEADLNDALLTAERIRRNIENLDIDFNENKIPITISIGAAEFDENLEKAEVLVNMADTALYKAKENGRNRIETFKKEWSLAGK